MNLEYTTIFNKLIFDLVSANLSYQIPFRIIIKNDSNWLPALPKDVMDNNPQIISLDISEWTLENSYIEGDSIFLKVAFEEDIYIKAVSAIDVLCIFSLEGTPILVKPFSDSLIVEEKEEISSPERSLNAFKRNNSF